LEILRAMLGMIVAMENDDVRQECSLIVLTLRVKGVLRKTKPRESVSEIDCNMEELQLASAAYVSMIAFGTHHHQRLDALCVHPNNSKIFGASSENETAQKIGQVYDVCRDEV
jgi:hypothetical protein